MLEMCTGKYQESLGRGDLSQVEWIERPEAVVGKEGQDLESASFPSGLLQLLICPMALRMFLILLGLSFPSCKRRYWTNYSVMTAGDSFWCFLLWTSCDDTLFNFMALSNKIHPLYFKIVQSHVKLPIHSFLCARDNSCFHMEMIWSHFNDRNILNRILVCSVAMDEFRIPPLQFYLHHYIWKLFVGTHYVGWSLGSPVMLTMEESVKCGSEDSRVESVGCVRPCRSLMGGTIL